jgi:hypothetical protein
VSITFFYWMYTCPDNVTIKATVLFFSSFNITDPSGAVSTSVKLDPPMTSVDGAPDIAIQRMLLARHF